MLTQSVAMATTTTTTNAAITGCVVFEVPCTKSLFLSMKPHHNHSDHHILLSGTVLCPVSPATRDVCVEDDLLPCIIIDDVDVFWCFLVLSIIY